MTQSSPYPTMSKQERVEVLCDSMQEDLADERRFDAACMVGALSVLAPEVAQEVAGCVVGQPTVEQALDFDPNWLETLSQLGPSDDIKRLVLLLRVDEACCGFQYLEVVNPIVSAQITFISQQVLAHPEEWVTFHLVAARRLRELPDRHMARRLWSVIVNLKEEEDVEKA